MFSFKKYELVKALHESDDGYVATNPPLCEYDNVITECFEKYFVSGCLYEQGMIPIPCFQCQDYYKTTHKDNPTLDKDSLYFGAENMNWLSRPITYLYQLGRLYDIDCDDPNVPWDCCCGCGLGGCKVPDK